MTLQPHRDDTKASSTPLLAAGDLVLGADEIDRLLTEEMPDVRIELLKRVAESHQTRKYSLHELVVAEQIFRVLVQDTEVIVRESLAQALKENSGIPHDIIIALARDVDTVAMPVIESSAVLTDSDLITLIQSAKLSGKPKAAARRRRLSEAVSTEVVQTRNAQAIAQLMKNPGARIPDKILHDVMREYSKDTDIMAAIAGRENLPMTVVEKVITLVSDSLVDLLRSRYNVAPASIAHESEKTREVATLKLMDGSVNPREVEKLVEQLQTYGRLTPSIILTSLCRGNLYFFEASLARLSNIPVRNAEILIHDKGGLGFKALYAKAGLPDKFFHASKALLEIVSEMQRTGEKPANYSDTLAQRLIAKTATQKVDNLSYILALIRQTV